MRTSKALIDMDGGELTLRVGDDKLTYRLAEAMRHSLDFDDALYFISATDDLIDECVQEFLNPDPYEGILDQEEDTEEVLMLGLVDNIKPTPGITKKMLRKMKRARRRHKKRLKTHEDVQQRNEGNTPSCGNKLDNSPSTFKRLCSSCFQIFRRRENFIHEPP